MKQVLVYRNNKVSRSHLGKIVKRRDNQVLIEYEDYDYVNSATVTVTSWFRCRNRNSKTYKAANSDLWYYDTPLTGFSALHYMSKHDVKYGSIQILDTALTSDAESAYFYALALIMAPFPEGLDILKTHTFWLFKYLTDIPGAFDANLLPYVTAHKDALKQWFLTNSK